MSGSQYIDHWLWAIGPEPAPIRVVQQVSPEPDPAALEHPGAQETFQAGYRRFRNGDFAGAVQAFATCLEEQPDWGEAAFNLSLAHWRCGNREMAASMLESAAVQTAPMLRLRAILAIEDGDWRAAQELEAQLPVASENGSEIAYNIGVLQQRAGLQRQALSTYKHALEQNPTFAEALLNLGYAFKAVGEDENAQSAWRLAVEAKPELAAGYFKAWLGGDAG